MILNESTYREVINGYTRMEWQPLLDLIPEIEGRSGFGEVIPGRDIGEGVTTLPYMAYDEIIGRFTALCYEIPVMVNFDWGAWKEGEKILRDPGFDYDLLDIPDKCRLITAIIRADRFSEGYLGWAFESGVVLRLLKSIEKGL